MINLVDKNLDLIEINEKRKKSAVKWLKTLNLDREILINLTASLMAITKQALDNFELSEKK